MKQLILAVVLAVCARAEVPLGQELHSGHTSVIVAKFNPLWFLFDRTPASLGVQLFSDDSATSGYVVTVTYELNEKVFRYVGTVSTQEGRGTFAFLSIPIDPEKVRVLGLEVVSLPPGSFVNF